MSYRRKIIVLVVLICLVAISVTKLPADPSLIRWYGANVFYPLQSIRGFVLDRVPFSVGDIIYLVAGISAVVLLTRWIYFIFHFSECRGRLGHSVLRSINRILAIYLLFLLGWGMNYYKQPLAESWGLKDPLSRESDSVQLVAFDRFLVEQLNATARAYRPLGLPEINERAGKYYRQYSDTKVKPYGLQVKPGLFGYFMGRLAIEGYYNPFTGEGQMDKELPNFVMPFVVCHEMAHQAGIAAEGDANLMAYAVATLTDDSVFSYSAYLNIWLYAHNRLYRHDTALAGQTGRELNPLTRAHIDTLRQLSKRYQNEMARYSSELFDSYLRMQNQEDGISSYGNVTSSAWQLEQERRKKGNIIIYIP